MAETTPCPRLPLFEPDGRISPIQLSEAVLRFASWFAVGSMVRHPIQAVSLPELVSSVLMFRVTVIAGDFFMVISGKRGGICVISTWLVSK